MEYGLGKKQIDLGRDVGLDYEKEHFLCRNEKEGRTEDGVRWVGPASGTDEMRIPENSCSDCHLVCAIYACQPLSAKEKDR